MDGQTKFCVMVPLSGVLIWPDSPFTVSTKNKQGVRPPTGLFYRKSPPQLYATHRKRE